MYNIHYIKKKQFKLEKYIYFFFFKESNTIIQREKISKVTVNIFIMLQKLLYHGHKL